MKTINSQLTKLGDDIAFELASIDKLDGPAPLPRLRCLLKKIQHKTLLTQYRDITGDIFMPPRLREISDG